MKAEVARITTMLDQLPDHGPAPSDILEQLNLPRGASVEDVRERLTVLAGHAIATRAEQIAGITAEQARQEWQARLDNAHAAADEAKRRYDDFMDQIGWDQAEAEFRGIQDAFWALRDRSTRGMAEDELKAYEEALQARYTKYMDARQAHIKMIERQRAAAEEVGLYDTEATLKQVINAEDEVSKKHLAALADGYRKAIAELRPLGGEHTWDPKSAKRATEVVERALDYFPSDWVQHSARHLPPVLKVTRRRAHYSPGAIQRKRARQVIVRRWLLDKDEAPDWTPPVDGVFQNKWDAREEWRRMPEGDDLGSAAWDRVDYELYDPWKHRRTNSGKPAGHGWKEFKYLNDGKVESSWRRPVTKMVTLEEEHVPEVTLSLEGSRVGPPGHRVAVHELSHRFEHTVPGLSGLENTFLVRRTTNADGQRERLVPYLGSRRERTRPDSFADVYVGKDYNNGTYFEVLSVGMESLFSGSQGGLIGMGRGEVPDHDHRAFVLGALGTAGRTRQAER